MSVTENPESLMRVTMSSWCECVMLEPLTARIRSPTCNCPHRSAGLPSIIRPGKKDKQSKQIKRTMT